MRVDMPWPAPESFLRSVALLSSRPRPSLLNVRCAVAGGLLIPLAQHPDVTGARWSTRLIADDLPAVTVELREGHQTRQWAGGDNRRVGEQP